MRKLGLLLLIFALFGTACGDAQTETAVSPLQPTPAAPTNTAAPTTMPATESATTTSTPTATMIATTTPQNDDLGMPEKPIASLFPAAAQTAGDVLILYGHVLDVKGNPIPNATVEIWQTDHNGIYNHPNDPNTNQRDLTFQFYGASLTDAAGTYVFRTIKPAEYGSRPSHIHVKVKLNGVTVLTTQFYFEEDRAIFAAEGIFAQAGSAGELLVLQTEESTDMAGNPLRLAGKDIVVDTGLGAGLLPLTPAQTEGPYYPLVNIANYDNDLTILP